MGYIYLKELLSFVVRYSNLNKNKIPIICRLLLMVISFKNCYLNEIHNSNKVLNDSLIQKKNC